MQALWPLAGRRAPRPDCHGKEGVAGSSPAEGFGNRATARFSYARSGSGDHFQGQRKWSPVQDLVSAGVPRDAARRRSRGTPEPGRLRSARSPGNQWATMASRTISSRGPLHASRAAPRQGRPPCAAGSHGPARPVDPGEAPGARDSPVGGGKTRRASRTVEATANPALRQGAIRKAGCAMSKHQQARGAGRRIIRWLVSAERLAPAAAGNGDPAPLLALEVCRRVDPLRRGASPAPGWRGRNGPRTR